MTYNYYTINDIINIQSDRALNQVKLMPITACKPRSNIDLCIITSKKNIVPIKYLRNVDRFYSNFNSNNIIFLDKYYKRHYCIYVTDILGQTTIKASPPAFQMNHQTLHGSAYDVIYDLIHCKLIEKGYTYIHSACVSKDGIGKLYAGFCGTGKTKTVHDMLKLGYSYVADDLTLVDNNGNAYLSYVNSTVSYNDFFKHNTGNHVNKLRCKILESNPALMKVIALPKVDIANGNTVNMTKVKEACVLYPNGIPMDNLTTDELYNKILNINEYSIKMPWSNRLLQMYSFFNYDYFNIESIRSKYLSNLKSFLNIKR